MSVRACRKRKKHALNYFAMKCRRDEIKKAAEAALTLLVLRYRGKCNKRGRFITFYNEYAGDNERNAKIAFHYAVPAANRSTVHHR